jgi:hypothetical protein
MTQIDDTGDLASSPDARKRFLTVLLDHCVRRLGHTLAEDATTKILATSVRGASPASLGE